MWTAHIWLAVPGPHCALCAVYEKRVMTKAPGEALPPDVVPCKDFVMSDAFRDWAVAEMRREVLGQVSMAGLDRMAILKDGGQKKGPKPDGDGGSKGPVN
jgi:hypothetical protein